MFWRFSFTAIFFTFATPAIADSWEAFTKCIVGYGSSEASKAPRPTPADFEKTLADACGAEDSELAKEIHHPYMKPLYGVDMTEANQHTDKYNKDADERQAKFERDIRNIEISNYTEYYYGHPQ